MDNIIYTSEGDFHLRMKNGKLETIPTLPRGQWGASMDDAGRVFRNVNDAPLFADFVAVRYYARNPNLVRTRGLYEPLISREDSTIWPVRATRGVNRGYRDQFFRPDDSSLTIQGVGTPVVYRGDQLPKELYGDAFITDSPTNLVHRYKIVDDGAGRLTAVDGYKKGEIMASWDERFRPVNLLGGPDGTLYVVDMYRGIVQEQIYWTDFLKDYIGDARSAAAGAPRADLADRARHDQGAAEAGALEGDAAAARRRSVAPERLVARHGAAAAGAARRQVGRAAAETARRADRATGASGCMRCGRSTALMRSTPDVVQKALADKSPDVRAAAIRLSERWLNEPNSPIAAAILKLATDPSWTVRRQLAATVGELPQTARLEPAAMLLTKYGSDPILVDVDDQRPEAAARPTC